MAWQGLLSLEPTSNADSLMVFTQPLCAMSCINICAHIKNSMHWQSCHCLELQKILHTLIGMGSAALEAAVPYPGKATQISYEG